MTTTIEQQHHASPKKMVHFDLSPGLGLHVGSEPCMLERIKNTAQSMKKQSNNNHTFTLYLIRHGEAAHNILEKAAKQEALENCIEEGYDPDSPETLARMDAARQAVLHDDNLFDACLSDQGKAEAQDASRRLREIVQNHDLPFPEHVLVSPLTRTLETANLIFPQSHDIHVREELRERQTGKPPDTRSPSTSLMRRKTFARFSMDQLRQSSLSKLCGNITSLEEMQERNPEDDDLVYQQSSNEYTMDGTPEEEDKYMLRDRTNKLLDLLANTEESTVAVVTHKGYLRELERGPFDDPSAKEFKNCEIRVYQVKLNDDKSLDHARRIA